MHRTVANGKDIGECFYSKTWVTQLQLLDVSSLPTKWRP